MLYSKKGYKNSSHAKSALSLESAWLLSNRQNCQERLLLFGSSGFFLIQQFFVLDLYKRHEERHIDEENDNLHQRY